MSSQAVPRIAAPLALGGSEPLRVAFVGPQAWVDSCCPQVDALSMSPACFRFEELPELDRLSTTVADVKPHVTVVFDPALMPAETLRELPGLTLGVLVGGPPTGQAANAVGTLDRVVSFIPAFTGEPIGAGEVWRAIPPPVSDALFAEVRPTHGRPRAMAFGRSTPHREQMLMPAKHHHDLLQVIHGVYGEPLTELLAEYDVGVYVPGALWARFGPQVGIHLAAGQLLLAEALAPTHGLEQNIDYLQVDSPEEVARALERLERFPEMYYRIRVRGRLKAERYRASRVFSRVAYDLFADVAAFGSSRRPLS